MTEKRFHSEDDCVGYYTEIIDEQKKLDLTKPNPKKNLSIEELVDLLNKLSEENEQLKKENQRMTDKLNELALEFLNYDMVTMGKATEISEMCYSDFLKFRKENGKPMELKE